MSIEYLIRPSEPKLAYRKSAAAPQGADLPAVLFCGGYRSDMEGTKAQFLEECCRARGQEYIRFDYRGHGSSAGDFADGTIGAWYRDTQAVLDSLTARRVVIAGSSMGGWIALLLGRDRPERVAGIVGIAAAPDFTSEIEAQLDEDQKRTLAQQGYIETPNDYSDEPYIFTRALIEDGAQYCLLDQALKLNAPLHLVQGMCDEDVPWQKAHRIKNAVTGAPAEVFLVESGDHRLSRPEDLVLIDKQVMALSQAATARD